MTAAASNAGPAPVEWQDGVLILTRVLHAPRELVFAAWTDEEHFARWWGPHGATLPVCRLDARPGGAIHYCHRFGDHPDVWIGGVYREVAAPERIAFTCWFSDPAGGRVERPGFPAEMTISITLAPHPDGTRLTARHEGLISDQGEVQGWNESLDRLASHLAETSPSTP